MTKRPHGHSMSLCNATMGDLTFKMGSLYVGVLLILQLQVAAGQQGFVSIDCGSNSSYTDARGIEWRQCDIGKDIAMSLSVGLEGSGYGELRLLPSVVYQGLRHNHFHVGSCGCVSNEIYLIRPSFLLGNLPVPTDHAFSISIDSSVVDDVLFSADDGDALVSQEYYVVSKSEEIVFCLLPKQGNPFISSLELRYIVKESFADYMYKNQYGVLAQRMNCGANDTDPSIRYPDDHFDRIWETPGSGYTIPGVWADETLQNVRNTTYSNNFFAPPAVMASAWSSNSIAFSVSVVEKRSLWMAFHLGEVEILRENQQRVQNIFKDKSLLSESFTFPHDGNAIAVYGTYGTTAAGATKLDFVVRPFPNTTLPPVLNGFEIHMAVGADTRVTESSDRKVLDVVRESLNLMDWTGDPCFPVPWDWLTCSSDQPALVTAIKLSKYGLNGTIPQEITDLPALGDLWLDGNFLTGNVPNLSGLKNLQTLHLQNNSLSGGIPATLADIPDLWQLYLQYNDFTGPVPTALTEKSGLHLQVDPSSPEGSPEGSPVSSPSGSKSRSKGTSVGVIVGAIVGGLAAVVVIVGALIYCLRRRRENAVSDGEKGNPHQREDGGPSDHNVQTTRPFSLGEVSKITNNFERQIGQGGFGPVYLGTLDNGARVAVKVNSENSGQGRNEFLTEVKLLSRIHHRNLVHLVGFCDEDNKRILLYEFMEEGTLRDHLYGAGQTYPVNWPTRLQIAIDAARGLEYLHYDCHPRIIHRDVKSNNILLNGALQAKVADFGISKFHEEGITENISSTRNTASAVKGTFGYLDPEYFSTMKFTYKSDVYSFGVILLEMLSGRAPVDCSLSDEGQWTLINYARHMLSESKLEMFVDKALGIDYNKEAMWKVAELAMRCVEIQSINRPEMREVLQELCEASQYGEWVDIPRSGTASTMQTSSQVFSNTNSTNGSFSPQSYQHSNSSTGTHDGELHGNANMTTWMPSLK